MQITFIVTSEIFKKDVFKVKGNWCFPCPPRIGETIHPAIIANMLELNIEDFIKESIDEIAESISVSKNPIKEIENMLLYIIGEIVDLRYVPGATQNSELEIEITLAEKQ